MLIAVFAVTFGCARDEDAEFGDDSTAAPTVSATVNVYDGGNSNSRSLARKVGLFSPSFIPTNNSFGDVTSMTVSVTGVGAVTHVDAQTISVGSEGRWTTTLLNLPTGVILTFSGLAYDSSSTLLFTGTVSTTLSLTKANVIALTMYPASNGTTQTFPIITSVVRPSSMDVGTNADLTVNVKGSTDETLNYYFNSDGGTFSSGQCTVFQDVANDPCAAGDVDFTLSGSTGSIVSTYTAPTVIPSSGKIKHSVRVTNSQNNAIEVSFNISLTNGASRSRSYSLEPSFAPVITGLTGFRGDSDTDSGVSTPNYVTWGASVDMVSNNSVASDVVYWQASWSMSNTDHGSSVICHPDSFTAGNQTCSGGESYTGTSTSTVGTPGTFSLSLPAMMSYTATTSGTLSLSITQGNDESLSDAITTTIFYTISEGLFPDDVIQDLMP